MKSWRCFRNLHGRFALTSLIRRPKPPFSMRVRRMTSSSRSAPAQSMEDHTELFNYTSGRWIPNDALRHAERRRLFKVPEFKRLAAESINQDAEDVVGFEKLAEGGFNRSFLITMRNHFQFVARIPYLSTEPKHLVVASEVATMDFLRMKGIPVPKIHGYSNTSKNAAGTEYIFMDLVGGTNLGDIWFTMSEKARIAVVTKLVELESRLFSIQFPASGSLYYTKDLQDWQNSIPVTANGVDGSGFCIGPDTTLGLWYGKRLDLQVGRGPYKDPNAALVAGARKEIAYLEKFGRSLHPFQRLRREVYDYQKQSHLEHIEDLNKFLLVSPHLLPNHSHTLLDPTIRHPDLQPNNIFVSKDLEITGLIDWQNCTVLPRLLQCGIPSSFQNYGDSVSESLQLPKLPTNFDDLGDREQFDQVEKMRKRQLHYYYVTSTARLNAPHFDALQYDPGMLRRKLFHHASDPWEGDNMPLRCDLIRLAQNWSRFASPVSNADGGEIPPCPIAFPEDVAQDCLRLESSLIEADEQFDACKDIVGVGPEGWVPSDRYDEAKQRESQLKVDALDGAESEEERARLQEHWIFDDFGEDEYS